VVTRIKKVTGSTDLFLQELRSVLNLPAPANGLASYDSIRIRTGGTIEIKGHRAREVREWLAGLGF
jgi:Mitochondrial large subunit ribosomal protein (Img2)